MDIQLPQILFQIINFGVVLGALTMLLYKPIQQIMDERASRIADSQVAAEAALAEKKNLDALKQKIEREAEKKAAVLLDEASKKAMQIKREATDKAKTEAQAEVEKLRQQWTVEKQQLMADARSEMVAAVIAVSQKVIGLKLDSATDEKLITTELNKLIK